MSGQNIASSVTAAVATDAFLKRVLPWPGPDGEGWINLHWTITGKKGVRWRGEPFKTTDELVRRAQYLTKHEDKASDIFYCLSVQSQCKTITTKGGQQFNVALRDAEHATLVKAIWLDVDVKPPPKGYATLLEAINAVNEFCEAAGIPNPSGLVASGGGLHVYWISDRPLTVDEWRPYAEGLKAEAMRLGLRCDHGVTADVSRILRMPGSPNDGLVGHRSFNIIIRPLERRARY